MCLSSTMRSTECPAIQIAITRSLPCGKGTTAALKAYAGAPHGLRFTHLERLNRDLIVYVDKALKQMAAMRPALTCLPSRAGIEPPPR